MEKTKKSQTIEEAFRAAVQDFRGRISLRIFTCEDDETCKMDSLNLSRQNFPAIRIVQSQFRHRYVYTGDFTTGSIQAFGEAFLTGQLKPFVLSEPIPSNSYDGDVRIVVGDTFRDIVLNEDNDVLLLGYNTRYGDWSGFKDFSSAATQLKDIKNLVFAKIDIEKNEIEKNEMDSNYEASDLFVKLYLRGQKSSPIDLEKSMEYFRDRRDPGAETYIEFLKEYAMKNCRRLFNPVNQNGDGLDLISYIEKTTGSVCEEVVTVSQAQEIIASKNYVGFFFGSVGSNSYSNVIHAIVSFDEIAFVHSDNNEVRAHYGMYGEAFILFNKITGDKEVFYGPFQSTQREENQLKKFISSTKAFQSMVIHGTWPSSLDMFWETWFLDLHLFLDSSDTMFLFRANNEAGKIAEAAFKRAAENFQGKILLRVYIVDEMPYKEGFNFFNITQENLPCLRIVQTTQNRQKYAYNGDLTESNIKSFAMDFFQGKLTPYFFSQAIPTQPYEDNVRIVVGETFDNIVLNSENDVLLFIYDPSFLESEILQFHQSYSVLASRLKDVKNLVIAKIDGSANEVDGMLEFRLPAIRFYPRGKKYSAITPEHFSNRFETIEEAVLSFLRIYSTVSIPDDI